MKVKTTSVVAAFISVDLDIHKRKSNILKCNTENTSPITLDGKALKGVESSTNLGSIIDEQGGSDADVKVRICKTRTAFLQLKNTWNSKQMFASQHQSQNLQCEHQDSSTVWS
ncbi:unnamed protein product [Schistosoma margrebowiei]|uniref:Uncharacterized protein n=1 Tax=Schistosoma margrebowiei TaxID=48269 RepID=A0A183MS09_9TREM|nr:unnamed protein product [Schistosoma margrebowiei]